MDISGRFMQQLPVQTGEGKNGTWQKGGFVIETSDQKFPKKVCFTTWGDTIAQTQNFQPGDTVKVYFDLESREYSGKWYSDIKAWKIEQASGANTGEPERNAPAKTTAPQNTTPAPGNGGSFTVTEDDDLPF